MYFDIMRRKERPLPGTAQFVITETLQCLKDQGYEMATLGTAPLANEHVVAPDQARIIELSMDFAFKHLGHFHHLKPVYQFKEQFGASWWEGRYLAYWPDRFNPVILYAILKTYDPGGVSHQLKQQLHMAWHGVKRVGQVPQEVIERVLRHDVGNTTKAAG